MATSDHRPYSQLSFPKKLEKHQEALDALENDPEFRAAYEAVGIDADWRADYAGKIAVAAASITKQGAAKGTRKGATLTQGAALAAAEKTWRRLKRIAEVVFHNAPAELDALGLTDDLPDAYADRLARFRLLDTQARAPERLAAFATRKVMKETLDGYAAQVEAAAQEVQGQDARTVESEDASQRRKPDFEPAEEMRWELVHLAPVVLEDHPQLAEKLGLLIR